MSTQADDIGVDEGTQTENTEPQTECTTDPPIETDPCHMDTLQTSDTYHVPCARITHCSTSNRNILDTKYHFAKPIVLSSSQYEVHK